MNLVPDDIKYRVYETVERSFDKTPSYEELVCALLEECQQHPLSEAVTKEIIVGYFFFSIERIIGKVDAD
jgi:hypothetical protein